MGDLGSWREGRALLRCRLGSQQPNPPLGMVLGCSFERSFELHGTQRDSAVGMSQNLCVCVTSLSLRLPWGQC